MFRQDLFHRINVFPITVPPLRDRKEDVLPTAMSILIHLKKKHNLLVDYISHDGVQALKEYDWPGNVRELENTLERVALIHDKSILNVDDIKYILDENQSPTKKEVIEPQSDSSIVADNIGMDVVENKEMDNVFSGKIQTLKELEYKAIREGLERTNWNMTTTAQQLGISRMTLYRKLDQHGLRKKD